MPSNSLPMSVHKPRMSTRHNLNCLFLHLLKILLILHYVWFFPVLNFYVSICISNVTGSLYSYVDVTWSIWNSQGFPLSIWPHLFRDAGHEKSKGEQLKSLAFSLYIGRFLCAQLTGPVHRAQLGRVFFCVFSLGLCFVCSFVLFDLFVCPHSVMFPWAVDLPYSFWR